MHVRPHKGTLGRSWQVLAWLGMPGHKHPEEVISDATFINAKNKDIQSFFSKNIDDHRILQSDLVRVFWPKTCEAEFSQIWGL